MDQLEVEKTILKCPYCKDEITLEDDNVLYYGTKKYKHFYHYNCLIEKVTTAKRGKVLPEEVDDFVKGIINESINQQNFYIDKGRLERWIHDHYKAVVLPRHFLEKLEKVYLGFYDGLTQPIPPRDILDMWQRQVNNGNLRKIRSNNIRRGLKLSGLDLINYELAVIINKYDSYLEWKRGIAINKANRQPHEVLTNFVSNKDVKSKKQIEDEEKRKRINGMIDDFMMEFDEDE